MFAERGASIFLGSSIEGQQMIVNEEIAYVTMSQHSVVKMGGLEHITL